MNSSELRMAIGETLKIDEDACRDPYMWDGIVASPNEIVASPNEIVALAYDPRRYLPRMGCYPPQPLPPPPPGEARRYIPQSEEEEKALRRMDLLERTALPTIQPMEIDALLPHLDGMDEIQTLLWNVLVKPSVVPQVYLRTVGRLTNLHFCLVGPAGAGRRTALRAVCASLHIEMLTISPHNFLYGDLGYAVHYATTQRPCVIYLDGFEMLCTNPRFNDDFQWQVYANCAMLNTWDQVWLAFGVETEGQARASPVFDICSVRYALVRDFASNQLVPRFFEFLATGLTQLSTPLTAAQARQFAEAVEDCVPADLRTFAGDVMYAALARIGCESLARCNGVPFATRPDSSCTPFNWILEIDWERDAEPLYSHISAHLTETGQERRVVPRRAQREMCRAAYK